MLHLLPQLKEATDRLATAQSQLVASIDTDAHGNKFVADGLAFHASVQTVIQILQVVLPLLEQLLKALGGQQAGATLQVGQEAPHEAPNAPESPPEALGGHFGGVAETAKADREGLRPQDEEPPPGEVVGGPVEGPIDLPPDAPIDVEVPLGPGAGDGLGEGPGGADDEAKLKKGAGKKGGEKKAK
jgi:hypothetical protein